MNAINAGRIFPGDQTMPRKELIIQLLYCKISTVNEILFKISNSPLLICCRMRQTTASFHAIYAKRHTIVPFLNGTCSMRLSQHKWLVKM